MFKRLVLISFLLTSVLFAFSQNPESAEKSALYKYERAGYLMFNTNGWGFGIKYNKFKDGFNKRTFDYSFSSIRSPKQVRRQSGFYNGQSYFYGKENFFYLLRANYGRQKLITTKPYWGGVEMRYYLQGGFGLGLAKPVYLYIYNQDYTQLLLEKFDPLQHDWSDIQGAAPFAKGFDEITFHPSISLKASLDFEFGAYDQRTKNLEVGIKYDFFPYPFRIMALEEPKYHLIDLFFAFHFGSRFNK